MDSHGYYSTFEDRDERTGVDPADQSSGDASEFEDQAIAPTCPRCGCELATVPNVSPSAVPYIMCLGCDSTFPEKASLGDVIECQLRTMPDKLQASLDTQDALDYGNLLVASGRWKVVE